MSKEDQDFWKRMAALGDAVAELADGQYVLPVTDRKRHERMSGVTSEFIQTEKEFKQTGKRRKTLKCICGERASLIYRDVPIRVNGVIITVKNAPGYVCAHCGEGMTLGSDSRRMTELAKIVADQDLTEIEFSEKE